MGAGVGVLAGVFRKVVAIAGTSRHSVKDNSIWMATCLCQESACSDDRAARGLNGADDKTDRLNVLRDELGVADGVDRRAIQDHPIEVEQRFFQQAGKIARSEQFGRF